MLLLWLDLNSSYAHSSLALPAIHAQVEGKGGECGMEERFQRRSIQMWGSVVAEIVAARPDVVAATAWLFTHEVLLKITARVKALLPECTIIFGDRRCWGIMRNICVGIGTWLACFGERVSWDFMSGWGVRLSFPVE